MGYHASIHVKTESIAAVLKLIQKLSGAEEMTYGRHPDCLENYIISKDIKPSCVTVSNPHEGWVHVQTNYFGKMGEWLKILSGELNTMVVQVIWQTVTDIYNFIVYDNGIIRRKIEIYYGELDNIIDEGEKFDFEKISLVPEHNEDFENLFARDDVEEYCRQLGFELFDESQSKDLFVFRKKSFAFAILRSINRLFRS